MADITFNTEEGKTIARELLIAYLNTGTAQAPVWSAIGKRVEDSDTEYDWDSETKRDILGATYGRLRLLRSIPVLTITTGQPTRMPELQPRLTTLKFRKTQHVAQFS